MYLDWAKQNERRIAGMIREMVEIESPSDDPAAVNRFVDWMASQLSGVAKVKIVNGGLTLAIICWPNSICLAARRAGKLPRWVILIPCGRWAR